eukprot:8436632-Pyramimonas_sp.AAC.1
MRGTASCAIRKLAIARTSIHCVVFGFVRGFSPDDEGCSSMVLAGGNMHTSERCQGRCCSYSPLGQ